MRIKWFLPILIGAIIGTSVPVDGSHTFTYRAKILPPAGSSGQSPVLTCGWHNSACGTDSSGNSQDWDNTNTNYVYFRGIFSRNNSPSESTRLFARRVKVASGSSVCDIQKVYLIDSATFTIRGVMEYIHTSMNSTAEFPIGTSSTGRYNVKNIGSMIVDTGCTTWTGTHVHAGYKATGKATRYKNTSLYPNSGYCEPSAGTCKSYTNNTVSNWTHYFLWGGP